MLFFAWIRWKSGSLSYYAASAKTGEEALEACCALADRFGGRGDIVTGEAFDWPDDPPCPMRDQGKIHAFKLRSRDYSERALYSLGILASDIPAAPPDASPSPRRRGGAPQAPPVAAPVRPGWGGRPGTL